MDDITNFLTFLIATGLSFGVLAGIVDEGGKKKGVALHTFYITIGFFFFLLFSTIKAFLMLIN